MRKVSGHIGALLAVVLLLTSCGSSHPTRTSPSVRAPSTPARTSASASKTFTSATYGYTMALPTDWTTIQAVAKWDGRSGLTYESAQVDQFASSGKNVSGVAARWNRDLAAYTRFWISWITRYHGQTCPVEPNSRTAATIGGQPGVLLAYNCGILINQAITVHNGVGYDFLFRDPSVAAASNPADHAMFMTMLSSIRFPAAVGFTQR